MNLKIRAKSNKRCCELPKERQKGKERKVVIIIVNIMFISCELLDCLLIMKR